MKKTAMIIAIGASAFLAACGDKDEATNVPDNAPVEQSNTTNTSVENPTNATNSPFNFTHFELDASYVDNKSYEVSYENESTGAEAKIEDEVNNSIIEGNQAMDKLVPIFESLTFDATTPDDEVINEVLQKFELTDNYKELEIDVQFADGTKKEYRQVQ